MSTSTGFEAVQSEAARSTALRLEALRRAMRQHGVAACLIPSADPHLSEYLPAYWKIRQWLTGFTGSVGTVTVTQGQANLWVDSRYWVQAQRELEGSGFELQRLSSVADPGYVSWLAQNLGPGSVLAVDGRALSLQSRDALEQALTKSPSPAGVLRLDLDLPGEVWTDRPALPVNPVSDLPLEFAGQSRAQKLARVRADMVEKGASHHFISTVDDIAWLLNLRGSDVEFNPVFLAHLLLTPETAQLFVAPGKLDASVLVALARDGVKVQDYPLAAPQLSALLETDRLLLDPSRVTSALVAQCKAQQIRAINPSTLLKSCKIAAEMVNWRQTMVADGVALCEFFSGLEKAIEQREERVLTELMIDEQITAARARRPGFVSRSFSTIAAFNANGAMPHYRATEQSHSRIEGDGLLLIDSGGQYLGGTTDITRMVAVGALSDEQRADCTAVLQAMIAMSRLRFPEGTLAPLLDVVARAPLWQHGLDYGHGTGHGVGYFLNVHEGPQVLSYRAPINPHMAMRAGMVTSNEPGVYRAGQWGVRIENLTHCREVGDSGFGVFLEFETLTLCPIDTRCFLVERLRTEEREWLNDYHQRVRDQLSGGLSGDALHWLLVRTEPLPL
jgi:Xaa-Pro aminopeptidase